MFEKDQDTVKLLSINPASKRHGSVWGEKTRQELLPRQSSPDTAPSNNNSVVISPGRLCVADEIKLKRREAAKWITALTDEPVPFTTDKEFRAALRSGVLLCRIMNEVAPGTIKVVHAGDDVNNTKQRYENVQNFMSAAIAMGVPTEYMLSMPDLESDSADERPRVADCILWLRRLHGGTASSPSPLAGGAAAAAAAAAAADVGTPGGGATDSPRRTAHAAVMRALHKSAASAGPGGSPAVGSLTSRGGTPIMMHTSDQISALQGMSALLKEKMSYSSATAAASTTASFADVRSSSVGGRHGGSSYGLAVDAMGPVLENVLGNLTQEYERRLLSKDQEIQSVKDKLHAVQREMDALHQSMSTLRQELEAAQAQAAVEAAANAGQRLVELEQREAQLQSELEARQGECAELRQRLAVQEGAEDEARRHLELELEGARARLLRFDQVAESYKKVQEENRRLYNTVQDLRGAIRVFCRIRPAGTTGDSSAACVDVGSEQELGAYDPTKPQAQPRAYRFDRVFGAQVTQEEIYADAQPLIRSVLDGFNVCIFAYGQTGSGKTHTMTGTDVRLAQGRGINYRALDDLFQLRNQRSGEIDYSIQVTMLEIYNESLRDLLVDNAGAATNRLEILNTLGSGLNVRNITKIDVNTTDDVMEMMSRGARNRHSAETKMNQRSSRSHQVLTVIVSGQSRVTGVRTHACLHLVDLAGSERTSKSEVTGDRLVEANHINSSLTSLGSVMAALASKNKHVPFRDSKLTQLLADSLSGQAKVMMFVHVSPEGSSYQETTSTLKFAERVSSITLGEAKRNAESGEVYKSHEEIARLRDALRCREDQVAQLGEALRQAEARGQALAARLGGGAELLEMEGGAPISAGSTATTSDSRLPASTAFGGFLSPAPSSSQIQQQQQQLLRSSLPASPAMFGSAAGTPVMQTISESDALSTGPLLHRHSSSGLPTPPSLQQQPLSPSLAALHLGPQPTTPATTTSGLGALHDGPTGAPATGGRLAGAAPSSNVTPVSARSSGVHNSSTRGGGYGGGYGGKVGSASMREGSRWGAAGVGGGGAATPTMLTPSPSSQQREQAAGAGPGLGVSSRPPARPPMPSSASATRMSMDATATAALSSSMPRTSSLPPARSPPVSSLPRPATASSNLSPATATASARPGTTWQRSSSSSGAAPTAAAASQAVPASAGGQRSSRWGGSSASAGGAGKGRWN